MPGSFGWVSWNVKDMVQSWVNGTTNYGFLMMDSNETHGTNKVALFYSKEYTDPALRPMLVIDYTPPAPPPPNNPPYQPVNVSPSNGAIYVSMTLNLQSSAFSDPDASDTHAASQWQITTISGNYTSPVFNSGNDTANLVSIIILPGTLEADNTYYWRVRHQDNRGAWSEYSLETSFTTTSIVNVALYYTVDTTVSAQAPATNYGSVTSITIQANNASNRQRGLAQFDLSSIPAGSTINSATFGAYYYSYYSASLNPVGRTYYLYRNTGPWAETGVNWNNKPGYTTSQGASTTMPASFGWVNWNVKDIVQTWVNGAANCGFVMMDSNETQGANKLAQFYSREYTDPALRPMLVIDYTPPGPPPPNNPPDRPVNAAPSNGATDVSLTLTLQSSAFSDPDVGEPHAASQWQITTAPGNYTSPVFDSSTDTVNLLSMTVPSGKLNGNTTYCWHVRHQDNRGAWSEYSLETSFTTTKVGNVTSYSMADTRVAAQAPNTNYGTETAVAIQANNSGNRQRGLAQFDLSSIPAGSTINSATFGAYYYSYYSASLNPVGRTYYLYQNTGPWTETGVNWNNKPGYTTSQGASTTMPASFGWVNWNVKDIVQTWVNGAANYGLTLMDSNETQGVNKLAQFYSREYTDTALRPVLVINYIPPGS